MWFEFLLIGVLTLCTSSYIVWKRARQELLTEEAVFDTILLVWLCGILVSRVSFVVFHFDSFGFSFLRWLLIYIYPGLSIGGALIGGIAGLWYFSKRFKLPFWKMLESVGLAFIFGMGFSYALHVGYVLFIQQEYTQLLSLSFQELLVTDSMGHIYVVIAMIIIWRLAQYALKRYKKVPGFVACVSLLLSILVLFLVDFIGRTRVYYGWIGYEQIVLATAFVLILACTIIRVRITNKRTMMSATKKLLTTIDDNLKKEEEQAKQALDDLKKEDPFNDPTHVDDNAASDTEAFEQSSHMRIESLMRSLRNRIRSITAARNKIARGTYGTCEVCKKPISPERLQAMPTASICISCEKKQENAKPSAV